IASDLALRALFPRHGRVWFRRIAFGANIDLRDGRNVAGAQTLRAGSFGHDFFHRLRHHRLGDRFGFWLLCWFSVLFWLGRVLLVIDVVLSHGGREEYA